MLLRKITNIYSNIAQKYGNVTIKDFRKYGKLEYKRNKLKLDIDFLNNRKQLGVYPKFLIFKLPNVSDKDALFVKDSFVVPSINVIKNSNIFQKNSVYAKNSLSTQISAIAFYILTKSITSYNKKLLQKSLYAQVCWCLNIKIYLFCYFWMQSKLLLTGLGSKL